MAIEGTHHAVLTVVFALPPGTTPEKAHSMLSQGGVNVPLGLVQFVRAVDVNIVDAVGPKLV